MKFWICAIFMKHFLNNQYEYAIKQFDDVIASQSSMYFVHGNDKNPIFQLICIFILTVQVMFLGKLQNFRVSYLPYLLSDFNQIFTVLFLEKVYSFY